MACLELENIDCIFKYAAEFSEADIIVFLLDIFIVWWQSFHYKQIYTFFTAMLKELPNSPKVSGKPVSVRVSATLEYESWRIKLGASEQHRYFLFQLLWEIRPSNEFTGKEK